MTDWCILRTRGSNTLRLARSLGHSGFEAWTPTEIQVKRHPKTRERSETIIAVMPTYVFATAEHLLDLVNQSQAPDAEFSVFRWNDRFPIIADLDLRHLRQIEREAAAKCKPVQYGTGQQVRVPDGPYQGLTGQVVETSKGRFTLVAFPGFNIPVKFASWKLEAAA